MCNAPEEVLLTEIKLWRRKRCHCNRVAEVMGFIGEIIYGEGPV